MSYCRWSSDGYQCDLYAYADVAGCWTIHVAQRRHKDTGPIMSDYLRLDESSEGELTWNKASFKDFSRATKKWLRRQKKRKDKNRFIDIGLAHDGETIQCGTLGAFYDKMNELIHLGYKCDIGVLTIISDEINKHGRDQTIEPDEGVPEEFQYGEKDL